jgi:hypothetical protein
MSSARNRVRVLARFRPQTEDEKLFGKNTCVQVGNNFKSVGVQVRAEASVFHFAPTLTEKFVTIAFDFSRDKSSPSTEFLIGIQHNKIFMNTQGSLLCQTSCEATYVFRLHPPNAKTGGHPSALSHGLDIAKI